MSEQEFLDAIFNMFNGTYYGEGSEEQNKKSEEEKEYGGPEL